MDTHANQEDLRSALPLSTQCSSEPQSEVLQSCTLQSSALESIAALGTSGAWSQSDLWQTSRIGCLTRLLRAGGKLLGYYLREDSNWSMDIPSVKSQVAQARSEGIAVRGLVFINPGALCLIAALSRLADSTGPSMWNAVSVSP